MRILTALVLVIEADEPFGVAAPERGGPVDRPVASTPDGVVHVPGSSLAGSLRDHLRRHGADVGLMGSGHPTRSSPEPADGASPSPSRLQLLGTQTTLHDRPLGPGDLLVRHQTAIDRTRAAARDRTLRSTVLVPAGARIRAWCLVQGRLAPEELHAIGSWAPRVGGGRSAGRGRASLVEVRHGEVDLHTEAGLTTWLQSGGPDLVEAVAATVHPVSATSRGEAVLDRRFAIEDAILSRGSADDGTGPNVIGHLTDDQGAPVVEGSSLKGVFRSRIEVILRSLGVAVCDGGDAGCPADPVCPVCLVFGSVARRGRLGFHSATIEGAAVEQRDHVGIDRISGGARHGLLFSERAVVAGSLRLVIDAVGGEELPRWVPLALEAVALDLHEGCIGLGGRTHRGYGTVRCVDDVPPSPEAVGALAPALDDAGLRAGAP